MSNFKQLTLLLALVCATVFFSPAKAQGEFSASSSISGTARVEAPVAEEKEEPKFDITGAVDAYYLYSANKMPFTTSFTDKHNSFALGMANIQFSKKGKVGFMADLAFGPRALAANGYATPDGGISMLSIIKQLYLTYAPTDWLTLTAGNFSTFVGYEVIDAPVNLNYSTSYMFTNGPFFHTGLKANFQMSEKWGAMIGVFNDTDTKIDVVPGKHIGAQLSYLAGDLAVYLNYLEGKIIEGDELSPDFYSHQADVVATYALGKTALGLNATYRLLAPSEGKSAGWLGAALYANYAVSEKFKPALRAEYIADKDGIITGVTDNALLAFTLSGNIKIGSLTLIPELRLDTATNEGYFYDSEGSTKTSNVGALFAVVYGF